MFENLSNTLKKTTDKIANAIFLDKNLVNSVIRDLQRALIEADVNIKLVKQLTDKVKKTAIDERIKQIDKKEHIIKLLHDELIKILGEKAYELRLIEAKGKQNKIMLLGLYGAGKCIYGKSNVQLSDGNIIRIEELYDKYKLKFNEQRLEDGQIINISKENLLVPSFNKKTLKIENKKVTHLWKLNKESLIEVKLDNGNDYSIKVTPEHPFFALRNGKVVKIRADEITEEDYISIPREIETHGKIINLSEEIKKLNLFIYLDREEVKKIISEKNPSIKEINKNLKNKLNYCQFTSELKKGKIPIELTDLKRFNFIKTKYYSAHDVITFPLFTTPELAEFIGYIIGDGHITKNSVEIFNENPEIISRITKLSKLLFNLTPIIKRDFRTKKMYKIQMNSKTLVEILKIFNLKPGKKGRELKIPEQILLSSEGITRAFIRAYFDCDSHPSENKRYIELVSESQILIQQMNLLLNRFGIISIISKKIINNIPYWRLSIKAKYAERYANKINYLIKNKKSKVNDYEKIGIIQGSGNQDMIPLGKSLRELRLSMGFSIGEIQSNAVMSYGIYEEKGVISREHLKKLIEYYRIKKRGRFFDILQDISDDKQLTKKYSNCLLNGLMPFLKKTAIVSYNNNMISLTEKGQKQKQLQLISINNQEEQLKNFELISNSNVNWIPIKETKKVLNDEKIVYDLTVEGNHSFIAEGFIVHNTTTIAKLGNYYAKRGKKVALVGLDVHRPAAPEQLEQLAKKTKLAVLTDKKEKNPIKIWKKYEKQLQEYNVILIDTAGRDVLDKQLIKEIKNLDKTIKPTESILIMPADIGQAAKQQAEKFQEALNISGVIITRMDSTAKAGGALTACAETKAPVFFVGTGEKINDLEIFNPESFLSRLLGMGDLKSLLDKIKSVTDEKSQKKLQKRLQEGKFTMDDLYEQLKSMQSLGGFDKIKSMIPGFSNVQEKIPENTLEKQQEKMKKWKYAIDSMTPKEKENPELIEKQTSRISRIAKGAGIPTSDVRALLKQYKLIKDFTKSGIAKGDLSKGFSEKQMKKFAKKFGKKIKI